VQASCIELLSLDLFSKLLKGGYKMGPEKRLYRSVASRDSFVDDDELEAFLEANAPKQRWGRLLWYLAQSALVLVVIAQSIAIIILSKTANSSCHSIRMTPPSRTQQWLIVTSRWYATTAHGASHALPAFKLRLGKRRCSFGSLELNTRWSWSRGD
jgi:hypothetical protein